MITLVFVEGLDRRLSEAIQFLRDFSVVVRAKQFLVPSVPTLDNRDKDCKASHAYNHGEE